MKINYLLSMLLAFTLIISKPLNAEQLSANLNDLTSLAMQQISNTETLENAYEIAARYAELIRISHNSEKSRKRALAIVNQSLTAQIEALNQQPVRSPSIDGNDMGMAAIDDSFAQASQAIQKATTVDEVNAAMSKYRKRVNNAQRQQLRTQAWQKRSDLRGGGYGGRQEGYRNKPMKWASFAYAMFMKLMFPLHIVEQLILRMFDQECRVCVKRGTCTECNCDISKVYSPWDSCSKGNWGSMIEDPEAYAAMRKDFPVEITVRYPVEEQMKLEDEARMKELIDSIEKKNEV